MPDQPSDRKCPYCAEMNDRDATVCCHCNRDLPRYINDPDPYVVRD